jgi:hypothetical protein
MVFGFWTLIFDLADKARQVSKRTLATEQRPKSKDQRSILYDVYFTVSLPCSSISRFQTNPARE